mmetsp:Transcript_42630/g.76409  ORF Transcript_42630/g.76409 Transcript_42630/m.76409 type:complete len:232 (-) Transcript_42630:342-1037(-)
MLIARWDSPVLHSSFAYSRDEPSAFKDIASKHEIAAESKCPVFLDSLACSRKQRPSSCGMPPTAAICRRSANTGSCALREICMHASLSLQWSFWTINSGLMLREPDLSWRPGRCCTASSISCSICSRTTYGYARKCDSIAAAESGPMISCRAASSWVWSFVLAPSRRLINISPMRTSQTSSGPASCGLSSATCRQLSSSSHLPIRQAAAMPFTASLHRASPTAWRARPSVC